MRINEARIRLDWRCKSGGSPCTDAREDVAREEGGTYVEGRSGMQDPVKVAGFNDGVERVFFLDILDDGVRELVGVV